VHPLKTSFISPEQGGDGEELDEKEVETEEEGFTSETFFSE
jgi:hypothetical protein